MPDYQNGKIYMIKCNDTDETYYGSTVTRLSQRKSVHKNNSIKTSASPIIDRNNWTIELIEDYPCNNLHELLTRERYYIDNNECVNKCCPLKTTPEKIENRRITEKIYRDKNKNEINKYHNDYYKEKGSVKYECKCGSIICHAKKAQHEKTIKHKQACVLE